jgi:hypothetical protein
VAAPGAAIRIDSGDNPLLRRELERVVLDREIAAIRDYAERETTESEPWPGALGLTTALLAVTPAEAAELRAQFKALLEPFADRSAPDRPGTRPVRFFLAATPLDEGAEK